MVTKVYGDPLIAVRLPAEVIKGIKTLAERQNTSVSAIVRDLIEGELKENGIKSSPTQIEGQMRIENA